MSRTALLLAIAIMAATHFLYYPKWTKGGTEATLSWDASGYYMYLPAMFIYKDIKKVAFVDKILEDYKPTPELQQAFLHEESGNYVMKYSIGQALILAPGFGLGHAWASVSSKYPADGFSFPYQFMISMWVLAITFLGLFFLRKVLLAYFGEVATGLTLLGLVLGSNYLNYAAIDGAMTHNTLFTVYTLLLYSTIRFYKSPSLFSALAIGSLVGLAALTRPTEIIAAVIPVLWGVNVLKWEEISNRFRLFLREYQLILVAVLACGLVGFLQLAYWKYVSGEWIVYSYREQGFSWLRPHLKDGLISYKSGWLTYSPFMIFTLIGFFSLYKMKRCIFAATFLFSMLFIYICFAWDVWWYGGALGQRAMVQSYPILAFPLAALFAWLIKTTRIAQWVVGVFMIVFVYTNIWFTHQAHLGGMLHVGQMRKAYFWKTLFTWDKDPENMKLLDDVNVLYQGERKDLTLFYSDTTSVWQLSQEVQFSDLIKIPASNLDPNYEWLRVSADFQIEEKEWFFWTMTQFVVEVYNHDERVGLHMIRVQRHMDGKQKKRLYIDLKNPNVPFTELQVKFWNADGNKKIDISKLAVESYLEG